MSYSARGSYALFGILGGFLGILLLAIWIGILASASEQDKQDIKDMKKNAVLLWISVAFICLSLICFVLYMKNEYNINKNK